MSSGRRGPVDKASTTALHKYQHTGLIEVIDTESILYTYEPDSNKDTALSQWSTFFGGTKMCL